MPLAIGTDDTLQSLSRSEASQALASLVAACSRSLWIRVPLLDELTADSEVCEAIKTMAISSERIDIRILFDDHDNAIRDGHRLVHLARRLPSRLQLRQTQQDDRDTRACHAIGDGTGLFEAKGWPRPDRVHLCGHRLPRAPRLARDFREHWERAGGNPELRELRL